MPVMPYEMTIEVLDGQTPASIWATGHLESLLEIAHGYGATDYRIVRRPWGVILELAFRSERYWDAFRADPAVIAALDAAPRVLTSRGWGGSAPSRVPRKPRPLAGAGAAELPLPEPELMTEAVSTWRDRVRELVTSRMRPLPV